MLLRLADGEGGRGAESTEEIRHAAIIATCT